MTDEPTALERFTTRPRALHIMATGRRAWVIAVRLGVVLVALGIIFLRMPGSFTNPQFLGEDVQFFFTSRYSGWSVMATPMNGCLVSVQYLVALLASYFSPAAAPALYNYAAIGLTLVVVWIMTSPRLDMPSRPLLAIAIVIVPMGYEELGTITDVQWILPIGTFALLFMSASRSQVVLLGEAAIAGLTAFSGPFSLFLTPLFLWRSIPAPDPANRRRLIILTAIVGLGALTQVVVMVVIKSFGAAGGVSPFSRTLWVDLPLSQVMTTFGSVSQLFTGMQGVVLGSVVVVLVAALACLPPYRTQKIFMVVFATAIAFGGMYKFRFALGTQILAQRYFYAGSVFSLWFLCCLSTRPYVQAGLAALVALREVTLLPVIANTPRIAEDLQWPIWGSYINSGLPVIIPTSPIGWNLGLPATEDGPLAKFRPWVGRNVSDVASSMAPSACTGELTSVAPLAVVNLRYRPFRVPEEGPWIAQGNAWDLATGKAVQLVALADSSNRIVGFGLPGFKQQDPAGKTSRGLGWIGTFYSVPRATIHAFGILGDGQQICPLANDQYLAQVSDIQPLGTANFVEAVPIGQGSEIVQRFKPAHRLIRLSVTFVCWARTPSQYLVSWRVTAYRDGRAQELGAGKIDASTIRDWEQVQLPVAVPDDRPDQIEVSFSAEAGAPPVAPLGLPLFQPGTTDPAPPAEVDGKPAKQRVQVGLALTYEK